jgi:hypothetical protein
MSPTVRYVYQYNPLGDWGDSPFRSFGLMRFLAGCEYLRSSIPRSNPIFIHPVNITQEKGLDENHAGCNPARPARDRMRFRSQTSEY